MVLWIEKYRPSKFDEIIGQQESIDKLKAMVEKGDIQHMILSGPPGVGKTTSAIVLAKAVFKNEWNQNFIELNASDDRKLSVIQGKVKEFARTKPIDAPFKLILFDEADSLTQEAQQALRRMMEEYSGTCRFLFSVNYQNNIIEPIQSRCAIIRFKPLTSEDVKKFVKMIADKEDLKIDDKAIEALIYVSKGDLRALTNVLQSLSNVSKEIDSEMVYKNNGLIDIMKIKQGVEVALTGNYDSAKAIFTELLDSGVNIKELIIKTFEIVTSSDGLIDKKSKSYVIERLAETEYRIIEGATPFIQFQAFLAFLSTLKS
ncbi:replication factor C small subunit [Candidatus Parvarchaeota archaeon]|jgi:replication factor C small subunit|nr:replication factor C small subunit [Candidatus Parvarchaeota archaeon]